MLVGVTDVPITLRFVFVGHRLWVDYGLVPIVAPNIQPAREVSLPLIFGA